MNKLHHLRDPFIHSKEELLFTTIGKGNEILIQGDSWVERFSESAEAEANIRKYATKKNKKIILAGTSSYAPSLYQAQLNVLTNEYNIKPKILVTFFDQTDIGDELCRYKNHRYYENDNVFVKSYSKQDQVKLYYMKFFLEKIIILKSDKFSLVKLISIFKLKVYEKYFLKFEKDCTYDKIQKRLIEPLNNKDQDYIENVINEYLAYVFSKSGVKKMLIVTHSHYQHLENNYKINIFDIIKNVHSNSIYKKDISFLNFDNKFVNKYLIQEKEKKIECVFIPGDLASHICDEFQNKVIVPKILDKITLLSNSLN